MNRLIRLFSVLFHNCEKCALKLDPNCWRLRDYSIIFPLLRSKQNQRRVCFDFLQILFKFRKKQKEKLVKMKRKREMSEDEYEPTEREPKPKIIKKKSSKFKQLVMINITMFTLLVIPLLTIIGKIDHKNVLITGYIIFRKSLAFVYHFSKKLERNFYMTVYCCEE